MEKPFRLKQVAVRLVPERPLLSETPINAPEDAVRVIRDYIADFDKECVCVVCLGMDCRPVNFSICSIGTLNLCIAEPRDLIKVLCLSNASRFMILHNHPSGSLTPSAEDIQLTDRAYKLGTLLGIPLCDHIIIGNNRNEYYSFLERGLMKFDAMQLESSAGKLQRNPMVAETITPRKRNAKEHDER